MASRLKSGRFIGAATSESARRQLMQPVPCWEKVWVIPESAAPGSTLKVMRWVKTDKKQVRSLRYYNGVLLTLANLFKAI